MWKVHKFCKCFPHSSLSLLAWRGLYVACLCAQPQFIPDSFLWPCPVGWFSDSWPGLCFFHMRARGPRLPYRWPTLHSSVGNDFLVISRSPSVISWFDHSLWYTWPIHDFTASSVLLRSFFFGGGSSTFLDRLPRCRHQEALPVLGRYWPSRSTAERSFSFYSCHTVSSDLLPDDSSLSRST